MIALSVMAIPSAASAEPLFEMPFPCGEVWHAATRGDHGSKYSDGYRALDMNNDDRAYEHGAPVLASAAGTVATSEWSGSYGHLVEVDHGGGWRTLYAHLDRRDVAVGTWVQQGQQLGSVGGTPHYAVHLHYEQVLGTTLQHVRFHGEAVTYSTTYDGPEFTSANCTPPAEFAWEVTATAAYADESRTVPVDLAQGVVGQPAWVVVQARNIGSASWDASGTSAVKLQTLEPEEQREARDYGRRPMASIWVEEGHAVTPAEPLVPPGASATFSFPVCTPTAGAYEEPLNLNTEQSGWFPGDGFELHGTASDAPAVPSQVDYRSDGVVRFAGADRVETPIHVSRAEFADGAASSVVLARSDDYPDALAGAPLAAAYDAPLLLTGSTCLDGRTEREIARVLEPGGRVSLLGGEAALSPAIAGRLAELGYEVERLAGASRFETAVKIAERVAPSQLFLVTGGNFADAVAAGAAAAANDGAILLTDGTNAHPATEAFVSALGDAPRFAVGAPAAAAHPGAVALFGDSRFTTATAVARRFFRATTRVGIANGGGFADPLAAGAHLARMDAPMLLSDGAELTPEVASFIDGWAGRIDVAYVYGGATVVSPAVEDRVREIVTSR